MRLVMFDVDGTLLTGNGIDDLCFAEALRSGLGIQHIDTEWSHYVNVTDSGVTSEIVGNKLLRKLEDSDIRTVRQEYSTRLRQEIIKNPLSFRTVPGAVELISTLCSMENVRVCIATGGWRDPALMKLRAAGFPIGNIILTSSDDALQRESIMLLAYERARIQANCEKFDSVLYVGDRRWDFANAQKLGWYFLGIARGKHAPELRQTGASHLQPDFIDQDYFLRVLETGEK